MFELNDAIALLKDKGWSEAAIKAAIEARFPDGKIDADGLEELERLLTESGVQYQNNSLPPSPSQENAIALTNQISGNLAIRDEGQKHLIRTIIEVEIANAIALHQIRNQVREGIESHLQSQQFATVISDERARSQTLQKLASGDGVQQILRGYGIKQTAIESDGCDREFIKGFLAAVEEKPADVDFVQAYLDEIGL